MIKEEYLNEGTLVRRYSDSGYLLLQAETGIKYSDPVDVIPCPYTYEETDELVEAEDSLEEAEEAGEFA